MKRQQQGAALIVVLSLLTISLMVGLSSIQSSQIDERLAGNYRAQSQAQMGAEKAAAVGLEEDLEGVSWIKLSDFDYTRLEDLAWEDLIVGDDECDSPVSCYYRYVEDGDKNYIVAIGSVDNNFALTESIIIKVNIAGLPIFNSPIVGCEGVEMAGGSAVGSYDSREGSWDGSVGGFSASDSPLVSTLTGDDSNIVLGGNEKIHGAISSYGGVTLNGSSTIHGNIYANSSVNLDGGGAVTKGNVETLGDIGFGSSAVVESTVKAGGDIVFDNWSASVGEAIYAGGNVVTNTSRNDPSEHLPAGSRGNYFLGNSGNPAGVAQQECDNIVFGQRKFIDERDYLKSAVPLISSDQNINSDDLSIGPWPNQSWELSGAGLKRFDETWNVNSWVSHGQTQSVENALGKSGNVNVLRVGDLNISQSGSLRVTGDVVLVVEGGFTISGGGQGLVIDPGSSLTVVVEGRTQFGSAARMDSVNTLNSNGDPSFSLFSLNDGAGNGVEFNGGGRVVANVYAPFTGVSVNSGADFYGSVRAKSVTVSGDGLIAYDEALSDIEYTSGGGGPGESIDYWR